MMRPEDCIFAWLSLHLVLWRSCAMPLAEGRPRSAILVTTVRTVARETPRHHDPCPVRKSEIDNRRRLAGLDHWHDGLQADRHHA